MYINDVSREATIAISAEERDCGIKDNHLTYLVHTRNESKEYFERLAKGLSEYLLYTYSTVILNTDNYLLGAEVVLEQTKDLYLFYIAWLGICMHNKHAEGIKDCLEHIMEFGSSNSLNYSDEYKFYRALAEFEKFLDRGIAQSYT